MPGAGQLPAAVWDGSGSGPTDYLGSLAWARQSITSLAQEIEQAIGRILEDRRSGAHVISGDDVWVVNEAGRLLARVMPSMTNTQGGYVMDGINVDGTVRQIPAGSSHQERSAMDHTVAYNAQSAAARQRMENFRASAVGHLEARREVRGREEVRELEELRQLEETQGRLLHELTRASEDMIRRLEEQEAEVKRLEEQHEEEIQRRLREQDAIVKRLEQQAQAFLPVASGPVQQHPTTPGPRPPTTPRGEVERQLQASPFYHQNQGDPQAQTGLQEFRRRRWPEEQTQQLQQQQHQAPPPVASSGPAQQHPTTPVPRPPMTTREEVERLPQAFDFFHQIQVEFLRQHEEEELEQLQQQQQQQQQEIPPPAQECQDWARPPPAGGPASVSAVLYNQQQLLLQQQQQPNDLPIPPLLPLSSGGHSPMSETSTHTLAAESITPPPPDSSSEGEWTEVDYVGSFGAVVDSENFGAVVDPENFGA